MSEAPTPSLADIAPAIDAPPPPPTPDAPAPTAPPPDIAAADPAPTELKTDLTESPTADGADTEPSDSIDHSEAPVLDIPEIPGAEIADKKKAKENIADAGYRVIGAGVKAAEDRYANLPPDQQEAWLAENPGLKTLLEFRTILNQKDGLLGGDKKGLVIGSEASPVKIAIRGADGIVQDVVITKLLKSSKGNFTCAIAGSTTPQEISHAYVAKAFLSSTKDAVIDTIPEAQQNLVAKYMDIITTDVMATGEDPLQGVSQEQVDNLLKSENANAEKRQYSYAKQLGKELTGNAFEDLVAKGKITKKETEEAMIALADELFGKQQTQLTEKETQQVVEAMESKLVDAKYSDEAFRIEENMPYQLKMLYSRDLERFSVENNGQPANEEQAREIKQRLIREHIIGDKLAKLSDPKYMEEVRRKFGWKDIAGLILFLTKDIGVHFAPSPQQHR